MKNLTFTLFFLSFFLSGNAQDYGTLKTTHEGHILIENSNFQGFLSFDDTTTLYECSYLFFSTVQYNGNGNDKDFLLARPLFHVASSNLIADKAGSSKIAILSYGRTYFSNIVSNANLNICKYSHRDGSIIPMLMPVSTTYQPDYDNIHLIDFPNGYWGIVGNYKNGDFSFPGMATPFVENNGQFKNFIIKFNGTTNQVVWQQEFVASTNLKPYTDTNGNLYLFGKRASNTFVTLGGLTLGVDTSVNITDNFYLAKVNAQGVPLLLKNILKTDTPIEVEFHLQDSAYYIVSQVDGQVIFDSSTVFNGNHSFIAKYNTNNDSLIWLRDAPISIEHSVLDLQNNIYFIGNSSNINWALDSTHFYNEIKFFGKINEIYKSVIMIPFENE